MKELLNHLGQLGRELPTMTEKEWTYTFNFLEYFLIVDYDLRDKILPSINRQKILEILYVLGKVKSPE